MAYSLRGPGVRKGHTAPSLGSSACVEIWEGAELADVPQFRTGEGLKPPELKLILAEAEERLDGNLWPTWGDEEEPGRELWLQCRPYALRCHL